MLQKTSARKPLINIIIYTFFRVLRKGMGFFLIPVYTKFLSTEEYGIVGVVLSISLLLTVFFNLSIDSTIIRFYFKKNQEADYHKNLYGSILSIILSLTFISFIFFAFTSEWILAPFLSGVSIYPYVYLALLIVASEQIFSMHQKILQAMQNAFRFAIQNLTRFVLKLTLIITFVVIFKFGAEGVLGASAITGVVFFIFSSAILIKNYGLKWNKPILKECFAYSLPLIPNRFAAIAIMSVNKLFVNSLKSTADAGIFHLATQIGYILTMLTDSIQRAYLPWCYDQLENHGMKGRAKIVHASKVIIIFLSTIALLISLFCKEIITLIAFGDFKRAWVVVPFFVFTSIFHMVKNIWLVPLLYNKRGTRYAPISTYTYLGLMVTFSLVLIPKLGFVGAGISSLLARFISTFVMMYFSKKMENIGYTAWKVYIYPLIMLALASIVYLSIPLLFIIKFALSFSVLGIVWWFSREDINLIYRILIKQHNKNISS